jgi:membrane protein YdbS with pleckstrin-like domain
MEAKELKPVRRWLWKAILELFLVWLLAAAFIAFMAIVIANDSDGSVLQAVLIGVGAWTPFLLLGLILMPAYFDRLRYVIHPDEVVVEVGIITQSVKHVPYRTVTNIQVARGPFDRLFDIGTLKIQTAGMSGQSGAEESLVGLADVTSVYQEVAATLRRFRQAMPPTGVGEEEIEELADGGALYKEVCAIRQLLEEKN